MDLHHQGACIRVAGTNRFVTLSLSGKFVHDPNTPEGADWAQYRHLYNLKYNKQLNVAAFNALQGAANQRPAFGNITLYPQNREILTRAVNIGLDGVLTAVSSGQVHNLDPAVYDRIPLTARDAPDND